MPQNHCRMRLEQTCPLADAHLHKQQQEICPLWPLDRSSTVDSSTEVSRELSLVHLGSLFYLSLLVRYYEEENDESGHRGRSNNRHPTNSSHGLPLAFR